MTEYGRRIVVELGFEAAVGELHRALRLDGLEVLARIDVRDRFWRGIGHDFRQYLLIEAWSPRLACEALCTRLDAGTILPTTFAIYELADGETAIVSREPLIPFSTDTAQRQRAPVLAGIADDEAQRVARVFATLSHLANRPRQPDIHTPRNPNDRAAVG